MQQLVLERYSRDKDEEQGVLKAESKQADKRGGKNEVQNEIRTRSDPTTARHPHTAVLHKYCHALPPMIEKSSRWHVYILIFSRVPPSRIGKRDPSFLKKCQKLRNEINKRGGGPPYIFHTGPTYWVANKSRRSDGNVFRAKELFGEHKPNQSKSSLSRFHLKTCNRCMLRCTRQYQLQEFGSHESPRSGRRDCSCDPFVFESTALRPFVEDFTIRPHIRNGDELTY